METPYACVLEMKVDMEPSNEPADGSDCEGSDVPQLPSGVNKTRGELEQADKPELIQMILENNAFMFQHMFNENAMLKEEIALLTMVAASQESSVQDLTRRFSNIEGDEMKCVKEMRSREYVRRKSVETFWKKD